MKLTRKTVVTELARRLTYIDNGRPVKAKDIHPDITEFKRLAPNKVCVVFEKQKMLYNVTLMKNGKMRFVESWIID